ncbi:uncharacterized protein LOC143907378 [Temnothorax americanus]|uniref:uncharacterized protein LOC143907378 n=1 Tax=Temnothorax americanus TaxID=1964332 RepID=UPI0040696D8E
MHGIILLLFILSVRPDGGFSENWISPCDYTFKQKYPKDKNISNTTVGFVNSTHIMYCPLEEVNKSVRYVLKYSDDDERIWPDMMEVQFTPPKRECFYGVALLFNPSIQDEDECFDYEFGDKYDDWQVHTPDKTIDTYDNWQVHTRDRTTCVFKHNNPFVEYTTTNYTTGFLYEDKIGVLFNYIFKGCYVVRFNVNHNPRYVMSNPAFANATYKRREVQEPEFICRYYARPNPEESKMTNFTLDITLPPDTGVSLKVFLISQRNKDRSKGCLWQTELPLFVWTIDLRVDSGWKNLSDQYCDVKFVETGKRRYEKRVQCNFLIEAPAANSCFAYGLNDERCAKNTIWKPQSGSKRRACLWVKHCGRTYVQHWVYEYLQTPRTQIQSDTLLSASSYLLLPIIAIVLIIMAVIGILCFRRYLRIRREEINSYVNSQRDDSNCLKSNDLGIIDDSEKEIDRDNSSRDNIVLLYTNSSPFFMALMKNFRKTLAKMCSCPVHDWHDGAIWNEVAKAGAVSWFTELLNNGCRVVWMDTPATRSAVISNSRDDETSLDKLSKYYEIHDFRDMAFRVVLEVAKSKVNVNDVERQYRRHFVVRFEGLESTANVDDPFLDLSPHARYYMPQHLVHLCSDLSVTKPKISKSKMKMDEDVYRLFVHQLYKSQTQQRLKSMKMDSTI